MRVLRVSHSAVVDAWREREREVRRRGASVRLLCARRWDEGGAPVELRPRPGEDVLGVRTWGTHPALFVYDPVPLWRALGQRWDVIDIHEEPFALATAEVLLLRALRGNRAPYTLYSAQNIDKRYPPPFRWLERWALRRASAVVVCNEAAGRIVQRKGFPGVADVLPLGVDPVQFAPSGASRETERIVRVGYVGRLAEHKGVQVLLDAVAASPDLRLTLAGAGPMESVCRARAGVPPLAGRVEVLGKVSQVDLPAVFRSVDVLAVPSLTTPGWVE
ncbi:MAG: glycosyltransferase, partial [Actinomycetota bacterium]|nr:glycosyltransferase [Actinomycetota bacterium]